MTTRGEVTAGKGVQAGGNQTQKEVEEKKVVMRKWEQEADVLFIVEVPRVCGGLVGDVTLGSTLCPSTCGRGRVHGRLIQ
ncbi:hypothetical protein Pcinc_027752 [Petrolisthes cinctipes]|uniref:Uncharacterized protein n=1 Tax=Petrolisthes cinctipes TaxID=88211 RepID=A0AAE1F4F2_PETCI|nr:hypothetical protein Pcinc_027752 [Petrolisthes cinctipes]